jgi:alpha-tubulin suppressor-like RCC1 family protein
MTSLVCRDPGRRTPRLTTVRALSLLPLVLACREISESPTASELEPSVAVAAANALAFRQVTVGEGHACGVTTNNVAYCWGSNGSGELGIRARPGAGIVFRGRALQHYPGGGHWRTRIP